MRSTAPTRFSPFFFRLIIGLGVIAGSFGLSQHAIADQNAGFFTDPATGIVYRKVTRTIDKPVVETKVTQRQQTIYKPKTVTETRPTTRRMYIPVTENRWVPQVEGRWNPFVQPRVAYKQVPETRWQIKDEVIAETKTQVKWEPETQTVSVPQQTMKMTREQVVDFEPIGRVAPQPTQPQVVASRSNISREIAARLRPMNPGTSVSGMTSSGVGGSVNPSANASLAATERQNYRSTLQTGLRPTELMPSNSPVFVPPAGGSAASGIAGLPAMRIWR